MFKFLDRMRGVDIFMGAALLILVVGLLIFGMSVAIGHVEEKTSYGLPEIVRILGYLASGVIGALSSRPTSQPMTGDKEQAKEDVKDGIHPE